ncbi:hypothetical protein HDU98_006477 [Podochytrium sp. JEL0797]|nr:hypothetical protein HDU98_006477 [Podochytrium sp. JEL0797]
MTSDPSLHINTAKYIAAIEFKSDALEAENLILKRQLGLAMAKIENLEKQVPPPHPATSTATIQTQTTIRESLDQKPLDSLLIANATSKNHVPPPLHPATATSPAIQTRAMQRESLDSVPKKPRLDTVSSPRLLLVESGSNLSHTADTFNNEIPFPPPSLEFLRRNLPEWQTRSSAQQQPASKMIPAVGRIKCSTLTCNATFKTKNEQGNHVYNYHSMHANMKFPGGKKVRIERHVDGRVYCFCGKNYTAWSSLHSHAGTCDGTPKISTATNRPSESTLESDSNATPPSSQPALASTVTSQPPQNAFVSHRTIITQIMPDFPIIPASNRRAIDNAVIAFLGSESDGGVSRAPNGEIGIPVDLVGCFQEWIYDELKKHFVDHVVNKPE